MTIDIPTSERLQMVDITSQVASVVESSGARSGLCIAFCPHTTAGLAVNENADPNVASDIIAAMARAFPKDGGYRHSEGNSDGHIKSSLFGPGLTLLVEDGSLVLGTWQGIYLCEFDGPRRRKVHVKVVEG